MTRSLEGDREPSLVAGASAGDAARQDLAPLRDEPAQTRHLLIVDLLDPLDAKATDLAVLAARAAVHVSHQLCLEGNVVRIDVVAVG
jgi:hypothetical protein